MEEFKRRLLLFIKERYDFGQNKFEDYCGLNHGTISSIKIKGPSADIVTKISNRCPELNLNWLFRGEAGGDMLNNPVHKEEDRESESHSQNNVHHNQQVIIANWQDLKDILKEVICNK